MTRTPRSWDIRGVDPDEDLDGRVAEVRAADVVRLHQGLVVLAGALLVAAALAVVFAVGDLARVRDAGLRGPGLLVWLARLVTGSVAWLVLPAVLLAVPRLLRLPEADREHRWSTAILWATAGLGAVLAVTEVLGFSLGLVLDDDPYAEGRLSLTESLAVLGTGLVAAATAALALSAVVRPSLDA